MPLARYTVQIIEALTTGDGVYRREVDGAEEALLWEARIRNTARIRIGRRVTVRRLHDQRDRWRVTGLWAILTDPADRPHVDVLTAPPLAQ